MREDNTPTINTRTRQAKAPTKARLRLDVARSKKRASETTKTKKAVKKQMRDADAAAIRIPPVPKGQLQRPITPKAKFRKRQRFKAWLPTHIFHAKRAHMPPSKDPLWRMAIPLSPTQKCYGPTHRVTNARGAMAWDMSYMSTIGLVGPQASIICILKAVGVGRELGDAWWTTKAKRWLSGTRVWDGWVFERDSNPKSAIAPVTIIWQVLEGSQIRDVNSTDTKRPKRQAIIRVHPSAFFQVWNELLKLSKIQKPAVAVEDLRFEIGSIDVVGPASSEALVGTLWPILDEDHQADSSERPESVWNKMRSLSNPAQLPAGGTLAFDIIDPRLHNPPRTVDLKLKQEHEDNLIQTLTSWPVDRTQRSQRLFDRRARVLSSLRLPSQKSINRRKGQAAVGAYPSPLSSDPHIPIIAYAQKQAGPGQGTWTVMMPWKCVTPIWYSLMFYPLSTGGTIRFGGLEQTRQRAFEAGQPWFPADFPSTEAGKVWETAEQQKRKSSWESQPKDRRLAFDSTDLGKGRRGEIGIGWACDWDRLLGPVREHAGIAGKASARYMLMPDAIKLLKMPTAEYTGLALVAVKIIMQQQGVAKTCARVYRLPTIDLRLRKRWIERSKTVTKRVQAEKRNVQPRLSRVPQSAQDRREYLATMLLGKKDAPHDGEEETFVVPDEVDLIGFVTTGNFNLTQGLGTSIGSVAVNRVLRPPTSSTLSKEEFAKSRHFCIVRESGHGTGRLARWELA